MSNSTPVIPVIPVAAVLEIGRIPVEGRAEEPFGMLLSFQTAEDLRLALVAMRVNISFMERP